jgi:glucose/mannose transport system substrate-binding protein
VEVFSWWTGGSEAAGLEAMLKIFNAEYPDIEFINAAAFGGPGVNGQALLTTRLQSVDPPDSWQARAGQETIGVYATGDQIEPLNELYDHEGWLEVMPEPLIALISQDGNIYSVPVNIHRTNVLWYNPAILNAHRVKVPTTIEDWFAGMDILQAVGITPLALGEQSMYLHLLDALLFSTLGPEAYNGLWNGTTDWGSVEVTAALENYKKALTYTNSDAASLSGQAAAQLVVNDAAAFTVTGDWVESYFRELGFTPTTDYRWVPVPGSAGVFQFMSDSFMLAVGAPHPEGATAWMKIAGSKAGQEAFNPGNGSICARTDCDPAFFGEYQQTAMKDWDSNIIVGSLLYGVVANNAWKAEIEAALAVFIADQIIHTFQSALVAACFHSVVCQ